MKITKKFEFYFLIISLILLYSSFFIHIKFKDISFEQLLFTISTSKGANFSILFTGIFFVLSLIIITILILFLIYKLYNFLNKKNDPKQYEIKLFKHSRLISILVTILFCIFCFILSFNLLHINDYINAQLSSSKLFEENYVDGKKNKIEFPENKRNLIYIYAESLEATNFSIENGGLVQDSYIPNLEKLALENINFSHNNKLGGAIQVNNTHWTMAALVAHTAGIPLKISVTSNHYKGFSDSLPGVYNLGDILNENGYNNFFMLGSDADFGGRKDFFERHGNYVIYDYYYAKKENYIDKDYRVWWGYEDAKLFKFAKEKILEAHKLGKPFNFTLLTADTHFRDGYMDASCEKKFKSKYANSFYCSDNKIIEFINWIKEQKFYENTTIVIAGDHLTMNSNFYNDNNYQRTIYNTFINSPITPIKDKNRLFTTFDLFPTTLASLGVKIEGNKLGLGVNLFSEEQTLLEKIGLDKFNDEISKKSFYYDNVLLGNTYYEMQEKRKNKEYILK